MKVIMSNINLLIKQNLSEWRAFPSLQYVLRSTCSVSTSSFQPYFKRRNAPVSLNIKISNCPLKVKLLVVSDSLQSDKCNWHQLCLTLCNLMHYSPWGSSVHWILRARILEWIVIPFSREFSWPGVWTWVSFIAGRYFIIWATNPIHFTKYLPLFVSMTGVPNPNFPPVIWLSYLSLQLDFPCGSADKESAAMQETWVGSLGWEDPLEKGKATHSSVVAWRIPWTV